MRLPNREDLEFTHNKEILQEVFRGFGGRDFEAHSQTHTHIHITVLRDEKNTFTREYFKMTI